jgi:D-alanine-D-alanine ligase
MRVAVVYNDDSALAHGDAQDQIAVQGVVACARAVASALRDLGHEVDVRALGADAREAALLVDSLVCDVVFNLVEAIGGDARKEPAFAWLCELRGLAYTGSPPRAMTLCLEKPLTQALLASRGISVARNVLFERGDEPLGDLPLPAIVKPSREDASHGIASESVVRDESALRARARYVIEHYSQPALAEEFIEGREINVGLIETPRGPEVLPLSEIDYSGFPPEMPHIVSYAGKWIDTSRDWELTRVVAARDLSGEDRARIESIARRAFEALGLRGYGRVDLRLDARRRPFVIDVNANPDISPDAGFALAAARANYSYTDIVRWIAESALRAASSRDPS